MAAERLQVFRIIHPDAVVEGPSAPLDGIDILAIRCDLFGDHGMDAAHRASIRLRSGAHAGVN